MDKAYGQADPEIRDYVERTYAPEDPVLAEVRARSTKAGLPDIAVSALDGRLLTVLAAATGAKTCVEVGTLGGYSGVCLLRGMGPTAKLWTCELMPAHAAAAKETFAKHGFAAQAEVVVGPAAETLASVTRHGPFDLVFIDADKPGYPTYLEWAAENLRVGGMVLLDNSFLFNLVHKKPEGERAPQMVAMQRVHTLLATSGRWDASVIPTGEGLAIGVKRR